jgi:hypothetical protein
VKATSDPSGEKSGAALAADRPEVAAEGEDDLGLAQRRLLEQAWRFGRGRSAGGGDDRKGQDTKKAERTFHGHDITSRESNWTEYTQEGRRLSMRRV